MQSTQTKPMFSAVVTPQGQGWLIRTDLGQKGEQLDYASKFEEIDQAARSRISATKDLKPFDFDIKFEFPDGSPEKTDELSPLREFFYEVGSIFIKFANR